MDTSSDNGQKLIYQLHLPLIYQNRTEDATIKIDKN